MEQYNVLTNITPIIKKSSDGQQILTIYYDTCIGKRQSIEVTNNTSFLLEQTDVCNYIKLIAGDIFVYMDKKLYCYNGKYWMNDKVLLRKFISNELYNILKIINAKLYWDDESYQRKNLQLNKLKSSNYKDGIVKTYKEVGDNVNVRFDDKWYLLGFNNMVYDLKKNEFREYEYDDYVTITTGYDWREPLNEEINLMNKLIAEIMPIEEERELYLQILSTSLNGLCLEKFIIFNGSGRNSKGMIDDLLLTSLGNYGMIGNNGILFETPRTGANPEKANIHKKRLVILREPPENKKFENSVIKELCGGGLFASRGHYDSQTQKELNLTMIVECNKKPTLAEEPTNAENERIIDIYFRSTFTQDEKLVNHKENIYLANPKYKTPEFQQKHKFALMKILMDAHKRYAQNNYKFVIPETIKQRTKKYLELSYNIVQWFKDCYEHTGNKKDIVKLKDVYDNISCNYFSNLTKKEKRKYNKTYFYDYVQNNDILKRYYHERKGEYRNCLSEWKKRDD